MLAGSCITFEENSSGCGRLVGLRAAGGGGDIQTFMLLTALKKERKTVCTLTIDILLVSCRCREFDSRGVVCPFVYLYVVMPCY